MIRRTLVLVGASLLALVLMASSASAQYGGSGGVSVEPSNPGVGGSVTISGSGCSPSSTVTVSITQGGQTVVLGQITAGPDGSYVISAAIPNNFSNGTATITDTCGNAITITIGGAVTTGVLPRTGASDSNGTLLRVAVVLVAAGGVLVLSSRKRAAKVSVDA